MSIDKLARELHYAGERALVSWRVSFILLVHELVVAGGWAGRGWGASLLLSPCVLLLRPVFTINH